MAEVQPFRGWRYDIAQVGNLSDVMAPPYDVIDPEQQLDLYQSHPCNVVRLILNRKEPGDKNADERYGRAANFLKHWQREGILIRERNDALYVYHQEFHWDDTLHVRKGFLGRLRLEEFGTGTVFAHEQTMAGPKSDRLALTKSCKMNLSAIFGLYPNLESSAQTVLEEAIIGQTALEATDQLGVVHRMWPVTNHVVNNQVRNVLKEQPIFIADGHHRYETAVDYRNWLRSQGKLANASAAANFVMMMFVEMNDPGLAILPTHRLVSGLPELTSDKLNRILSPHFQIDPVGEGEDGARKAWEMIQLDGRQHVFGFGTAKDSRWLLARLIDAGPMETIAADQSDEWRSLGVSLLHKLVLEHLIGGQVPDAEPVCQYVHLMDEVVSAQLERSCQLACLVAPAGIEDVQQVASNLEKMPPKSTFFYPKLLSGLVFHALQ